MLELEGDFAVDTSIVGVQDILGEDGLGEGKGRHTAKNHKAGHGNGEVAVDALLDGDDSPQRWFSDRVNDTYSSDTESRLKAKAFRREIGVGWGLEIQGFDFRHRTSYHPSSLENSVAKQHA